MDDNLWSISYEAKCVWQPYLKVKKTFNKNASIGKWVSKSFNSLSNKEKLEKIVLADFLMH